ncbi:cilia- and flagella- associated protein 210-like [Amphiura filiformis]|uniref:cilia- and flagella- associated protein 210-like n=1 Tax=Amphiura filiformis TaxID=82378 RepID=UPI003B20E9A7
MSQAEELVRHGRRKGLSRGNSPAQQPDMSGAFQTSSMPLQPSGTILPDGSDLRQVTVLSKGDWNRIQAQLDRSARESERIRSEKEQKEALKQQSKDLVKNWSNTIAGQRLKKLEARKIREAKEEEERVQIDIEEAKFQAARRKEAIEQAKTLQYYQTDRVKGFHGALMLTEVLKEREEQIKLKQARQKAYLGKDIELLKRYQHELEEGILQDQKKAIKALKDRKVVANFQKAQMKEHVNQSEIEQQADFKEGVELKRQVQHYNTEKAKIEAIRRNEKEDLMNSHLQSVANRDLIRAAEQQKEEEEEEEIRIFAAAKKKMTKLRKEREGELWQKKQDRVNKMVNKLDSQLKAKADDEDDRIALAVAEREALREKEMYEKQSQFEQTLTEMSEHRMEQMKQREEAQRQERRRELEALALKMEADKLFAEKQLEKVKKQKHEARGLKDFHVKQMDEKQDVVLQAEKEKLEMDKQNLDLLAVEEQQFQEYAKKVINHCDKGGRNTYPLKKAAREGHGGGRGPVFEGKGGVRPSYLVDDNSGVELPHYQAASTEEMKYAHVGSSANTSKRLGFVW